MKFQFVSAKKVFIITLIIGIVLLLGVFGSCVGHTHFRDSSITETTESITQPESVYESTVYKTSEYTTDYVLPTESVIEKTYEYTVVRVIDGDTVEIEMEAGNTEKLRFIGVDTPESVAYDENKNCSYGKVASEYTSKLLTGKRIKVEYDEDPRDDYARLLGYVYLDDEMINKKLVLEGYAVAKQYPPNTKYAELFEAAQIEAEKNKNGMWADDVTDEECNLKSEYYIEY